ncbi:MAG: alanine--glyoxylate aminotransferase family protein [Victivallaceae bacterium]|nr:alanine--glyoxylate aminotransferase family protein [Victivallaceae bacterium]
MNSNLKLMIPGPTEVSPEVCRKLSEPMRPHYGPEFCKLYFEVVEKLKKVYQTQNDLYILAATSSSAMEIAVSHAVEPGGKMLICNNGVFGDRFTEMAEAYGIKVVTTRSEYGQPVNAMQVNQALESDPEITALALVHNESSTGVESPLEPIMAAARGKNVLSIVDTVSSMGGVNVKTDALGIDFCVSGAQKCFGAVAGLGFISVSDRAWKRINARKNPVGSWYLNLSVLKNYREKWRQWHPQGPNTAPVSLYLGLNQALDEILEEGLERRFERHVRARDAFRNAMRAMGLKLFVEDEFASKTLTAVCLPEGIDGGRLRENIQKNHHILLAGGLGNTANTVIRIGHLSRTASEDYLVPTIAAIEQELTALGAEVCPGKAVNEFNREFEK